MRVTQVAFGLKIVANVAIPGLPTQSDQAQQETVDLRIRLKEDSKSLSGLFTSLDEQLYASPHSDKGGVPTLRVGRLAGGNYYGFLYSDGVRFAVEREGREIWGDWPDDYTLEDACTYLMGPVIAFVLRLRGVTCLHASAVGVGDRAIAFVGEPGAGKSTTAAAFARLGYPVLSDDVVVLSDRNDRFFVQPGYPRVNLWPDSVRALFGSEDALPHITPTWDKQYLALDQNGYRFQSVPLPLGAIYILAERKLGSTAVVVEELSGSAALTTLVANKYLHYLLDREMQCRDFDVLGRLITQVPVRRIRPMANPSKLSDLCECIAADVRNVARSESSNGALPGH